MKLTDEQCKQKDNIPTSEIETDIIETQKEIDQYQAELNSLVSDRVGNKLPIYMREGKISTRKDFIDDLNSILDYRKR